MKEKLNAIHSLLVSLILELIATQEPKHAFVKLLIAIIVDKCCMINLLSAWEETWIQQEKNVSRIFGTSSPKEMTQSTLPILEQDITALPILVLLLVQLHKMKPSLSSWLLSQIEITQVKSIWVNWKTTIPQSVIWLIKMTISAKWYVQLGDSERMNEWMISS